MEFQILGSHVDNHHQKLVETEYCSGYMGADNKWNTGFYCPQYGSDLAVYCCGTSTFKYCCTEKPFTLSGGTTEDSRGNDSNPTPISSYAYEIPVIIAVACGMIAVLIFILVSSCFLCSFSFVPRKRSHQIPPPDVYTPTPMPTTTAGAETPRLRPIISIQPQQLQVAIPSSPAYGEETTVAIIGKGGSIPSIRRSSSVGTSTVLTPNSWRDNDLSLPSPGRFGSVQNVDGYPPLSFSPKPNYATQSPELVWTYSPLAMNTCSDRTYENNAARLNSEAAANFNYSQTCRLKSILRNPLSSNIPHQQPEPTEPEPVVNNTGLNFMIPKPSVSSPPPHPAFSSEDEDSFPSVTYSPRIGPRKDPVRSSVRTEYVNDLDLLMCNREEVDAESLARLIELDLDSKL